MKNFSRINNYYAREAAWQDWYRVEMEAKLAGLTDLAVQFRPPKNASYQVIDGRTAKLRYALEKAKKGEQE